MQRLKLETIFGGGMQDKDVRLAALYGEHDSIQRVEKPERCSKQIVTDPVGRLVQKDVKLGVSDTEKRQHHKTEHYSVNLLVLLS